MGEGSGGKGGREVGNKGEGSGGKGGGKWGIPTPSPCPSPQFKHCMIQGAPSGASMSHGHISSHLGCTFKCFSFLATKIFVGGIH